jgi:hypothetical protein
MNILCYPVNTSGSRARARAEVDEEFLRAEPVTDGLAWR